MRDIPSLSYLNGSKDDEQRKEDGQQLFAHDQLLRKWQWFLKVLLLYNK
jgi:hypothetical protein